MTQYYLGAYSRSATVGPDSDPLPPAEFPQFDSAQAGANAGGVNPYAPCEGEWMAIAAHENNDWQRLTRTVDLTGVTAAEAPALRTALNWDAEPGYDFVLLEARTAGGDDWTTLPEAGGATPAAPSATPRASRTDSAPGRRPDRRRAAPRPTPTGPVPASSSRATRPSPPAAPCSSASASSTWTAGPNAPLF